MRVLVLGCDGYIGWALTNRLLERGYEVAGVDDASRRRRVDEVGSNSLLPIQPIVGRRSDLRFKYPDKFIDWIDVSLGNDSYGFIQSVLHEIKPGAIIHLAEMPSAPWSMMEPQNAVTTQMENVLGTLQLLWAMKEECPQAHLIKLGTMGEYGTPECDIPEGRIPYVCIGTTPESLATPVPCPMSGLLFPRTAGSFYHLSKVHDTYNIEFACRIWGLRSTDIMQGIVYGNEYRTRFDYDQYFGTVINRFCAQAVIGHPLTIYGSGGQTRGYLPLRDSLQCIEIILSNPPQLGEYRTVNQLAEVWSVNSLADEICRAASSLGIRTSMEHLNNPRVEMEDHYYNPKHKILLDLGYRPTFDLYSDVIELLRLLSLHKDRVIREVIIPTTTWR